MCELSKFYQQATTCQDAVTRAGNEDIFELDGCMYTWCEEKL